MKFNKSKTKLNIFYPIVTLAVIFSILIFNLIQNDYKEYSSLTHMRENVYIATKLSRIVHEIQIERGLSIAYLVSKNKKFRQDLEKQRKETDHMLVAMKSDESIQIVHPLEIKDTREKIDRHMLKSKEILAYYSGLNNQLLSAIVRMAQSSTYPEITRELSAYSNFLFSKELVGIQRAVGTEIFSSKKLDRDKILEFYSLMVRQKQYITQILKYSPSQYRQHHESILKEKFQIKINNMENIILGFNQTKINTIDARDWFSTLTEKINNLAHFEDHVSTEVTENINRKLSILKYNLGLNILLNIISVIIFLLIVVFILRLLKNEKKLQKLTDEYVISSTTDTKGIITSVSQAFVEISGYTKNELIGRPHSIVRHPDISKELFEELWKTIKEGKVWTGEVKNKKKDGGHYWVKASIIPEFDYRHHRITGYTSLRHDITSEKSKEEFMANMSHELRTPLNSIIGFSDILKKKLKGNDNLKYIERVGSSARVLLKLINDILDLSKIKDSKFTIEPHEFNAYEEISQYSDTFKGLTSIKNISMEIDINTNLKSVFWGDWIRISQVILNIVSNAIKFTPKEGKVIFTAEYKEESLVFSVKDNGVGMKKEVQDKIFLPFKQADGSTTRKYGGTGLGLSITQSLVEMMKGDISLESEEGIGSIFTVSLPLKKVQVSGSQNGVIARQEGNIIIELFSDRVLVAEDNISNQLLIELLLKEYGITCDLVGNGEEAVEKYDPALHSFILMDENMPKMNGLTAMKMLRKKHKERCGKIIVLTANTMSGDKERFLKLGMDNYLPKPIDIKNLGTILKLYAKPVDENLYLFRALALTEEKTTFSEKMIKKLLVSYHKSSLILLESLKKAIKNNDYDSICRVAHDMKSTSGSLNYINITNLSKQMEEDAREKKEVNYMDVCNAFEKHIRLLENFILHYPMVTH